MPTTNNPRPRLDFLLTGSKKPPTSGTHNKLDEWLEMFYLLGNVYFWLKFSELNYTASYHGHSTNWLPKVMQSSLPRCQQVSGTKLVISDKQYEFLTYCLRTGSSFQLLGEEPLCAGCQFLARILEWCVRAYALWHGRKGSLASAKPAMASRVKMEVGNFILRRVLRWKTCLWCLSNC